MGHVRPLDRMQHQVAHLFAARQASHPGKHKPDLDQRVVPQARTCRERALTPQHVVPKLVRCPHEPVAHQAITTTKNQNNFAAARLTSST